MVINSDNTRRTSGREELRRKPVANTRQARTTNLTRKYARTFHLTPAEVRKAVWQEYLSDLFDDRRIA